MINCGTCRIAAAALALVCATHAPPLLAAENDFFGLLRARDLTPFGFLRLDMRPAHAVEAPKGAWGFEAELAYQNTWALSPDVEDYLESLSGRRALGDAELQAILALPGENYLVDLESATLDITIHRKFSQHWGGYAVLSAVSYAGGFLDKGIENFHDAFGFGNHGRPSVKRNDANVIFNLQSAQIAFLGTPTDGGLLDPTVGIRYSGVEPFKDWHLVMEAAVKLPIRGRDPFLSTGKTDFGVQATLQRFGERQAFYVSAAGVYFDGRTGITPTQTQVIPTLILGYERHLSADTHLNLQGYASRSIYSREETDLSGLRKSKYQMSLGVYHRTGHGIFSFAITENLQNLNNTPDVGMQLGWVYSPVLGRRDH